MFKIRSICWTYISKEIYTYNEAVIAINNNSKDNIYYLWNIIK